MDLNAIIAPLSALAAMAGAGVMIYQARANKKKIEADAGHVTAVTGLEGAKVIKDISEAAAFLLVPYRNENEDLRNRMGKMEADMSQLKSQYQETLEQLHREREQAAIDRQTAEDRTKDLVRSYENRINELKESLDEVRAQVVRDAMRQNGMDAGGGT